MISHVNYMAIELDRLNNINDDATFKLLYDPDSNSFIFRIENGTDNFEKNLNFLQEVKNNFSTWQKKFFINPIDSKSFVFCPGLNVDQILFSGGFNSIESSQLDLYTLQWMFSVAVGICIMHSKEIDYLCLTDQYVFIDVNCDARILNFGCEMQSNSTKIHNRKAFFSPEQIMNNLKSYEQKKRSDIYSLGVFYHEILTRLKHFQTYFDQMQIMVFNEKLKEGAIEYMDLKNRKDVPFLDLLLNCLNNEPEKRWTIDKVIDYLLNVQKTGSPRNEANNQYFNIENVDLTKYHQFILNKFGIDEGTDFKKAKQLITKMLSENTTIKEQNHTYEENCTFNDLKKCSEKGISYCYKVIDRCFENLEINKDKFRRTKLEYPDINDFDLMEIFIKNLNDQEAFEKELNAITQRVDTICDIISAGKNDGIDSKISFEHYYNIKYDTFYEKIIKANDADYEYITNFFKEVQRMSSFEKQFFVIPFPHYSEESIMLCPFMNISNFIFSAETKMNKEKIDLHILKWLFSIAMSIRILNEKEIYDITLNDKSIFIDSNMNAKMFNMYYSPEHSSTTVPYRYYFYSPEQFIDQNPKEVPVICKKKSIIFSYGILAYELVTRQKIGKFFVDIPLKKLKEMHVKGIDKLFELENKKNIPLHELLENCLKNNSADRWDITQVLEYLLKIDNKAQSVGENNNNNEVNREYISLRDIDINEYHHFIMNLFGIDPKTNYDTACSEILNIIRENKKVTKIIPSKEKCSFEELKKCNALGITMCDDILKEVEESYFSADILEKLNNFVKNNHQFSKYDVIKIFIENKDYPDLLDKKLDKLLTEKIPEGTFVKYLFDMDIYHNIFKMFKSPEYFELPYSFSNKIIEWIKEYDQFVQPIYPYMDRINSYEYLNVHKYLNDNVILLKDVTALKKLKWIKSVAEGFQIINQKGYFFHTFSSKSIFIDKNLNASLLVTDPLKNEFNNDLNMLRESFFPDVEDIEINDTHYFYYPPEIYDEYFQTFDADKIPSYMIGVLSKELIESNSFSSLRDFFSEDDKLKILKKPLWANFSSSNFDFLKEDKFKNELIETLNKCLCVNPKERMSIDKVCECFSKLNISDNEKLIFDYQVEPQGDIFSFEDFNMELKDQHSAISDKEYHINQVFALDFFLNVKSQVSRIHNKVGKAKKFKFGGVSDQIANQIALRVIMNNSYNEDLGFSVDNSYSYPYQKPLTMKPINELLQKLQSTNFLKYAIRKDSGGDPVIEFRPIIDQDD